MKPIAYHRHHQWVNQCLVIDEGKKKFLFISIIFTCQNCQSSIFFFFIDFVMLPKRQFYTLVHSMVDLIKYHWFYFPCHFFCSQSPIGSSIWMNRNVEPFNTTKKIMRIWETINKDFKSFESKQCHWEKIYVCVCIHFCMVFNCYIILHLTKILTLNSFIFHK